MATDRCTGGRHDVPVADHPTSCPCGMVSRHPAKEPRRA